MVLLKLIQTVLGLIAVAVIITQILIPLFTGNKLFPIFCTSRNAIEAEIREVQELLSEKELKVHLEELRAKLQSPIGNATAKPATETTTSPTSQS